MPLEIATAVHDRPDVTGSLGYLVDNPIVLKEHFSNLLLAKLRYDLSRQGKSLEAVWRRQQGQTEALGNLGRRDSIKILLDRPQIVYGFVGPDDVNQLLTISRASSSL